ncbi:DUF952 domain-containing protein [Amycolatopsis sp. H20-H5]|uniref:DUF952 domain-containing protein n=1 Tax=Amycolatopsis sp. H20-H5 TaxID=3046309 RepID=UPI002DBB79CA|nr:DUF952 domain-containing protein [Amycolatopsis sp. H20-H5]MEC3980423.1 DUF952 domain-containing protein [Amycolatopsis sp. H20-H5]
MILHICGTEEWSKVPEDGEYRAPSLDAVGYIHCSDPGTVALPANVVYLGRTDLLLLEIDPAKVGVPVRWEDGNPPSPAGIWFPHVYGPIPRAAVVAVHEFPAQGDGSFLLPETLSQR